MEEMAVSIFKGCMDQVVNVKDGSYEGIVDILEMASRLVKVVQYVIMPA